MRRPGPYDIVLSLAGHDAGTLYVVVDASEERLLLCDGRLRKLGHPKSKSPKHVRLVAGGNAPPTADKDIRQTLAQAAESAAAKEGRLLGER